MVVPPPTKIELRRILKERREQAVFVLDRENQSAAATMLAERVVAGMPKDGIVAAYYPIGTEIDTIPLIAALGEKGLAVALPHVNGRDDTPRFLRWQQGDLLETGPFKLRQPLTTADTLVPDIILAPLLGFDRALNRIGYGAGHYDRAFAAHPHALRIGLAWAAQECDAVPCDPWDIPLHAVATESEWIAA